MILTAQIWKGSQKMTDTVIGHLFLVVLLSFQPVRRRYKALRHVCSGDDALT